MWWDWKTRSNGAPEAKKQVLRLFEKEGNMPISQLVGEGVNGKHMHSYQNSNTGYWEWCNDCQCMVTSPCLHNEYLCCYERSTYIRLQRKYEAVEHGVQPTIESGGKKPAKKSKRKGSAPAKSG